MENYKDKMSKSNFLKNKKARTVLGVILLISLVVVMSFILIPKLTSSDESYPSNMSVLITSNLTDNQIKAIGPDYIVYNTTNETGRSEVIFFSGQIALQDENGSYQFFTNLSNVTYDNYNLTITFPEGSYIYHPYVTVNSTEYSMVDFLTNYPSARQNLYIYDQQASWHIYFNITNVTGVNITSFRLNREEPTCGDVVNDSDTITYESLYNFDFSDIISNNFTLDSLDGCTDVIIGNITSDKINDSLANGTLILDPVIVLQTAGTHNLRDAYVASTTPNTNYNNDGNNHLIVSFNSTIPFVFLTNASPYIMFNISSLPNGAIINQANLSLFLGIFLAADLDSFSVYHVLDHTWNNTNETTITWNKQPCGPNFDNSTNCNLTAETTINNPILTTFYNWSVSKMLQDEINEGDLNLSFILRKSNELSGYAGFRDKEYSDVTRRPKMVIDYSIGQATPTSCGYVNDDLNLTANISNLYGDCLIINASNIDIDCKGYTVTAAGNTVSISNPFVNATLRNCKLSNIGTFSGVGVYWQTNNSLFQNNSLIASSQVSDAMSVYGSNNQILDSNITSDSQGGLYLSNANNNLVNNSIIKGLYSNVYLSISSNNNLSNSIFNATSCTSGSNRDLYLQNSDNNILRNIYFTSSDSDCVAIYFSDANGNLVFDTNAVVPGTDVYSSGGSSNVNDLINVTFGEISFFGLSDSSVDVNWYLETQVNNTGGNGINGANVTVTDKYSALQNWSLTGANGLTSRNYFREYRKTRSATSTDYPYTIEASKSGISDSTIISVFNTNYVNANKVLIYLSLAPTVTFSGSTPSPDAWIKVNTATINVTTTLDSDSCKLDWDGVNETMDVLSSTSFGKIKSGLTDDTITYRVYCNSTDSGLWGVSETRTLYIDLTLPKPSFVSPTPNDGEGTPNTYVYVNVSTVETNIQKCILDWNGTNQTLTPVGNICGVNKSAPPLNGVYTYRMYVNDSAGNYNSTEQRTVYTNVTSPIVTIVSPSNNYYSNKDYVLVNVSVSSPGNTIDTCLFFNGTTNYTMSLEGSGASVYCNINNTGLADGSSMTYKIYANNTLGFTGVSSQQVFYVDLTNPLISYAPNNPANASWSSSLSQTFNVTITEQNKNITRFWINTTGNETVTTCTGVAPNYVCPVPKTLSNGAFQYRFYVNDSAGNSNATEIYTIYIDTTSPSINIVSPTSLFRYNTQSIWFNVSTTNPASWCGYSLDGAANQTMNGGPSNWNYNDPAVSEATHTVIFHCNNSAGTRTSSSLITFYVDASNPLAEFGTNPIDGYLSGSSTVVFDLKCSDNIAVSSIQLYGNWSGWAINYTNSSYTNNTWINKTVTGIPDGTWKWSIRCNDTTNNIDWETNRTFTVNTATPAITIVSPLNPTNNYYYNTTSIWFNITTANTAFWCGYSLDGAANVSMSGSGTSWYAQNTSMTENSHSVNFSCNNSVGVRTSAGPRTFYVDTIYPQYSNILPANNSYLSISSNLKINYTVTEANFQSPPSYIRQFGRLLASDKLNFTPSGGCPGGFCQHTQNTIDQTEPTNPYVYYLWTNDSAGNLNQTGIYWVHIDSVEPYLEYTSPTPVNDTKTNQNYLFVNISIEDPYYKNHTFYLYNTTGLVNSTPYTNQLTTTINWTNLPQGKYYYNITAYDLANNLGVNVTRWWTYDSTFPLLSYIYPTSNNTISTTRNINITLNYTELNPATAKVNITSITTPSESYVYTNNSIPSGTGEIVFPINGLDYGNWSFFATLNDTSGNTNTTVKWWIFINATTPIVTLDFPSNNYFTSSTSINLNCSARISGGSFADLANISLYSNISGVWKLDDTHAASGSSYSTSFPQVGVPVAVHSWTCGACDADGVCDMGSNYTFTVDNVIPFIGYSTNSDTTGQYTRDFIFLNLTATDSLAGIDEVIGSWTGTNYSKKASTLDCSGSYCTKNFTDLSDANYTVYGWANDSAGNKNNTATRQFQVDADGPVITITDPEASEYIYTSTLPLTINAIFSITDNVPLVNCSYNVTTGSGTTEISNQYFSCALTTVSFNVSIGNPTDYYLNMRANTSNHETIETRYFRVIYSATAPPGGGGGTNNTNVTVPPSGPVCGDKICVRGVEDDFNGNLYCQKDCSQINLDWLLNTDWWKWILIAILILVVIFLLLREKKKKRR